MFEGTDLSMAYGSMYEPMKPAAPAPVVPQPPSMPPPQLEAIPVATASHAQPPEIPYQPPMAMYAQQSPAAKPMQTVVDDSMWNRLAAKKWEVVKLLVLSFVVLLGISMDRLCSHYLSSYLSKAFLSEGQEFLVRLGYPVMILLVLWILKAM